MSVDTSRPHYKPIGVTGLSREGGFVSRSSIAAMYGEKGRETIRQMSEEDPVIGSMLFALRMIIRRIEWNMNPANSSDEAVELAQFTESCLHDMSFSWAETISEIISFLPYGWSFMETLYKRRLGDTEDALTRSNYDDGLVGWRKWEIRGQDTLSRWGFDEEGGIAGMYQIAPPEYKEVFIPIQYGLLFRTESARGNPEGRSVLLNAYRPWYFARNLEDIEAIGAERDLAGLPYAEVPAEYLEEGATDEQQAIVNRIRQIVASVRVDEMAGLVFPAAYDENGNKLFDFRLQASAGGKQHDLSRVITRYNQMKAVTVLADFIMLGHTNVGTEALATVKQDIFSTSLKAWVDIIADVVNTHAIPRLWRVNGLDPMLRPNLAPGRVESVDLAGIGRFLQLISTSGADIWPNPQLLQHLMEVAGLPVPTEEEIWGMYGQRRDEEMAVDEVIDQMQQREEE